MLDSKKKIADEMLRTMEAYAEFYRWAWENCEMQERCLEAGIGYDAQEMAFHAMRLYKPL